MKWAEVREKLKIGEEVKVTWVDADSTHDWLEIDEDYCDHEGVCETKGWILKIDPRFLVVYSTRNLVCGEDKVDEYCLTMKIPAGCIKRIYSEPDWGEPIELS